MKKHVMLTSFIFLLFMLGNLTAQTTCTCTTNITSWTGDFGNPGFSCTGSGTPTTYIIPNGFTVSTGFPTSFPNDVNFEIGGILTLQNANTTAIKLSVVVKNGGTFNEGLNTFGDFTLRVEDGGKAVLGNMGFPSYYLNITDITSEGVSSSITMNSSVTFDDLNLEVMDGDVDLLGATIEGALTLNVLEGNVDFNGATIEGLADVNLINGNLNLIDISFINAFDLTVLSGGVTLGGNTTLNQAFDIDLQGGALDFSGDVLALSTTNLIIGPGATTSILGVLTINNPPSISVFGDLNVGGSLVLLDPISAVDVMDGGAVSLNTPTAMLEIGMTPVLSGIIDVTGPDAIVDPTLPIELVSFTAVYQKYGHVVRVDWATATEVNVDRYELLRSLNGNDFEIIYTHRDIEDTNEPNRYAYLDEEIPTNQNVYYMLRSIDNDGTRARSSVVSVLVGDNTASALVYPNPTSDKIQLFSNFEGGKAELCDFSGRVVLMQAVNSKTIELEVGHLPKGIYYLKLESPKGFAATREIVVQ